ncbi:drug resistance transporter, EmrB/QacA subfamily [Opitutaceae bacterium TAV1]|nr:drug resistance transporter, EmrB/QacA subfamily [Opitutaceae bacterium TAV1]
MSRSDQAAGRFDDTGLVSSPDRSQPEGADAVPVDSSNRSGPAIATSFHQDAAARPETPSAGRASSDTLKRILPWLVAVSFFMESLDMTILNTAAPTVAAALGVAPLSLKSALTSYTLSLALFIPLSGWMADRFGTRRVFGSAIGIFTLGSLLCGLSTNLHMLVAARILQGIGGAMMMPVGRIAIVRTFPKTEIMRAMSFVVIPGLIGPLIGPLAGGAIVDYLHWRVIFFVNVPVGVIGLYCVSRYMPDYRGVSRVPLDFAGFLLFGGGVALLSHALEVFGEHSMALPGVLAMVAVAVALLLAYARHALGRPYPLLRVSLFRKRTFSTAVLGGFVSRLGIGGMPFLLPLFYQVGFGRSPVQAALLIMPQPLAAMTMKFVAPRLLDRIGYRRALLVNTCLIGVTMALFATIGADTPMWLILVHAYIFGFLMSAQYTSLNTLTFADLDAEETSMGSSMASVGQQLAMSFGVATGSLAVAMFLSAGAHAGSGPAEMVPAIRHAFVVLGALTILSSLTYRRLRPEDGDNVISAPRAG